MITLTEGQIKSLCGGNSIYLRGKQYYHASRVKYLKYDPEINGFLATVLGSKRYQIKIYFDENEEFDEASCTCPAYRQYAGYCKHIAAVLIAIQNDKRSVSSFIENKRKRDIQNIINYFSYATTGEKSPLNLEIHYQFDKENPFLNGYSSKIHFRVGQEKLYVIRSPKTLIESIQKNQSLKFGKQFTFLPEKHSFQKKDQPIIDMIKGGLEQEEISNLSSWGFGKYSIFTGKYMILSPTALKRFFKIMEDRTFHATINGASYEGVHIIEKDLPIKFSLMKDRNNMVLNIDGNENVVALTEDGSYFFYQNNIYKVSQEQQKYFMPFYQTLENEKAKDIYIPHNYREGFASQVLPMIEKVGRLEIDKEVEKSIYKPKLQSKIYLDKKGESITINIKFIYGDREINPFKKESENPKESRILVRDVERENQIMDLIEEADFKVSSEYIYLEGDEKIYEFILDTLPKLDQLGEIYYSDVFKNMKVYYQPSLFTRLQLNEDTDILEFSFDIEGIDKKEIADVFQALWERKKYYRLNKGGFLSLQKSELERVSNLLDYLNISSKDLEKDMLQIPKYRALYLDESLKKAQIKNQSRNIVFKQLIQNIKEPQDIDYEVPKEFKEILRDYQVNGFKWLKTLSRYGMGGILADDMGLGKTIQILTLLLSEKQEKGLKPTLVVAPTSLVYNWSSEVEKFTSELKALVVSGAKEERHKNIKKLSEYDLVITSYPLIRRDIKLYQDTRFRYCILDEAQHIKNPTSQNAALVKKIKAENRFALTGTPIENSLIELWSIFDFIMPGFLLSHGQFVKKYERAIIKEDNQEALNQLKTQIAPFILRRLKKEVLKELPEKIENKMMVDLTREQKLTYLSYLEKIKGEINNTIEERGFQKSHMKILVGLTRLRQICCHPELFLENYHGGSGKLDLLQEIIEESLQGEHRILLFSQFTSMLRIIRRLLKEQEIEHFYLDGSTQSETRGEMVKRFNNGERNLFLISLKAGGTGLNLTGADIVIHFDPWWNPAVEEQATDRAYRIGQENTVHVIKLITKGTIEEKISHIQEKKKKMIESVIQPGETIISKLTEKEIRELFEI